MIDDAKISTIIDLAVIDPSRRDMYKEAWPKLPAEEKIKFVVNLWKMWMVQLDHKMRMEMDQMIEEMANSEGKVTYTKEDFARIKNQMIDEVISEVVGTEEVDQLAAMRHQLEEIHDLVKLHEDDLQDIKKKLE